MLAPLARALGPLGSSRRVPARSAVLASTSQFFAAPAGAFDWERTQAWSFSAWLNYSASTTPFVMSKMLSSGTFRGFAVTLRGPSASAPAEAVSVIVRSDLGANNLVQAQSPAGSFTQGGPRFLVVTYDGSSSSSSIAAYANAVALSLSVTGTLTGTILNASDFNLGGRASAGSYTGDLDNAGMWSRVLSSGEVSQLYNAGRGLRYGDLDAGLRSGLVSYWDLDEFSDGTGAVTRADAHGSNHLTDTGNVASGPPLAL
jgi:hypothetical protein